MKRSQSFSRVWAKNSKGDIIIVMRMILIVTMVMVIWRFYKCVVEKDPDGAEDFSAGPLVIVIVIVIVYCFVSGQFSTERILRERQRQEEYFSTFPTLTLGICFKSCKSWEFCFQTRDLWRLAWIQLLLLHVHGKESGQKHLSHFSRILASRIWSTKKEFIGRKC